MIFVNREAAKERRKDELEAGASEEGASPSWSLVTRLKRDRGCSITPFGARVCWMPAGVVVILDAGLRSAHFFGVYYSVFCSVCFCVFLDVSE
jgi:hypothetical protein